MFRWFAAVGLALAAAPAWAQDQVKIGPAPDWARPITVMAANAGADTAAPIRVVMQDQEVRFGADGDDVFAEQELKFQTPQGLAAGSVTIPWNPETDTLTVHKVQILRGGKVIDVLADGQTFTVLRRETNLERATLDGVLTAAMQPEGLQVGDILDLAFSIKHRDPALQGRSQFLGGDILPVPVGRLRIREVWPSAKAMRWRELDGLSPAKLTKTADGGAELVVDMNDAERPAAPKQAPARFGEVGLIETTEFADWAAVSSTMAPLYEKAATLKPDSPLIAEIAKIRAASSDPKAQAMAALRLAQDQVRYVFLGVNDGGTVPADADRTWARRFGDCKGKTTLLLALLHGLGITAEPALVNTRSGDGMDALLPSSLLFDHVLVRATIDGKTYWLDGARSGDRSLDAIGVPNFGWALPVQASGAKLERLSPAPASTPLIENHINFDASAGLDTPAPAHLETILRGDSAMLMNEGLALVSKEDREKQLRKYWSDQYSWIDITAVDAKFDDATGALHLTMQGSAKMDWSGTTDSGARRYETDSSRLGWNADFTRDPGPHQDAPIAVNFPAYTETTETILLPRGGDGFSVSLPDVDQTDVGWELSRKASIQHGVFTMDVRDRALVPEFSYAAAKDVAAKLKALANETLYLNAPLGYRPTDADLAALTKASPTDADGYLSRSWAFAQRRDFDHALADIGQAAALKPNDAGVLNSRCFTRAEANKELDAALADCNAALKLAPRDAPTLDSRGFVYFRLGQLDHAVADYDAALAIAPKLASSLYIRGLIRRERGDQKGGDADVAAAKQVDPTVAQEYALFGVDR